jgi:RNA polymerase sigma factor (TIGR02999 family)
MSDAAQIFDVHDEANPPRAEQLLSLVYDELRKLAAHRMAHESPDHTLQATALVHEAYLQLLRTADRQQWDGRGHFFAAIAETMRRILVDRARQKQSQRRGGRFQRQELDPQKLAISEPPIDVLGVHEALARFEKIDKRKADLVKLRYFAGLSIPEAAAALGISSATADRDWAYARAWLHAELRRGIAHSDH